MRGAWGEAATLREAAVTEVRRDELVHPAVATGLRLVTAGEAGPPARAGIQLPSDAEIGGEGDGGEAVARAAVADEGATEDGAAPPRLLGLHGAGPLNVALVVAGRRVGEDAVEVAVVIGTGEVRVRAVLLG